MSLKILQVTREGEKKTYVLGFEVLSLNNKKRNRNVYDFDIF